MERTSSKLIRVEGGGSSIAKVDLDALLTEYGVTSESHRYELHNLNRGAKETGWWAAFKDDVSADYLSYVGFEAGAAFIRQFQLAVVPGLPGTGGLRRGCHLNRPILARNSKIPLGLYTYVNGALGSGWPRLASTSFSTRV